MAWDSDLDLLMPHTVTVYTGAPTRSVYGVESWTSTGTEYAARVTRVKESHRDVDGHAVEVRAVVWISATTAVFSTSVRISLPGGDSPPVYLVNAYADEDGYYYHKVQFGWRA